jgi:leader peptidase (prepilin peptidase)/N-methyltransferase
MHFPFADLLGDIEMTAAGRWLVIGWLAVMGGVFGSFINVVVYRLPRRMSLSRPGSRCPACGHAIRWHDNVPVLGWLILRGRCRDCGAAISPRYPLVEALVAFTSTLLAWAEAAPAVMPEPGDLFTLNLGRFAFHLLLLCTLICAALMEFDGHLAPPRMLGLVLILGLAAPTVWPDLRPAAAPDASSWRGLYDGVLGLLAALLAAMLAWPGWVEDLDPRRIAAALTRVAELALVGVFLGAGAVMPLAAVGMIIYCALQGSSRIWPGASRFGWAASLALVTLMGIVAGPSLERAAEPWAGQDAWMVPLVAGTIVAGLAAAMRFLRNASQ